MFKSINCAQLLKSSLITRPTLQMSRSITTAKSIIYSDHGEPTEVIKIHTHEIADAVEDQVVLKTLGFPVNPSDINQLEGVYPSKPEKTLALGTKEPSAIAGNEGLFEITQIGSNVKDLKVGDHVIPLHSNFGTWTSHNVSVESQVVKLPKDLTLVQGATISVNPLTAYQLVNNYGLKKGDWLIQNAGTSAVSQLVNQVAKAKGINVISVIRNRPNLEEVKEKLIKQGATKVITEEENGDRDVGKEIAKLSEGKIKLALNSVGGKSSANIARKLAPDSTLITYGGMSKQPVTLPTSLFIFKNLKSIGFWVTANTKNDPESKIKETKEIAELYLNGDLKQLDVNESVWKFDEFSDEEILKLVGDAINGGSKGKQFIKIE